MRFPLAIALFAGLTGIVVADQPPPDLAEYRTVTTAKTASVKQLTGPPKQAAHLGVFIEQDAGSVRIAAIEPESSAEKAGMLVGDKILAVDARPTATREAFRSAITGLADGDQIALTVQRNGLPLALSVQLGATSRPMSVASRAVMGVQMVPVSDGVRIERVEVGQPADKAGIKVGDVVRKLGDVPVTTQEKFRDVLGTLTPGEKVKVALLRDGKEMLVECALAADRVEGGRGDRARQQQEDQPSLANWDMRRPGTWTKPVYRLAVIPIAYADQKFNEKIPPAEWDKALFSKGVYKDKSVTGQNVYGSMNDYYQEISCGKFSVTGKVLEPVTVSKKRSEYSSTPSRNAMFNEALDQLLARDGKDALKEFDGLFFLYAGNRMQTQRGGIFWPHRSSMNYQGKRWPYFICPEGGERMASISVISHEFGHMLGLPDLYAKPENPGSEGVGIWCTMSTGHGREGRPLHFSAWCKEQLGWIKPCVIDPSVQQKLILAPIGGSATECYKVLLRPDGTEYLLLENRVRKGYDRDLPGEGMLIWRVVDGRPLLEESHGVTTPDGPARFLGSVPYPSKSNTAFTPYTTPASRPVKPGGLPVNITNIRKLPDGRIIFHIGYEYL